MGPRKRSKQDSNAKEQSPSSTPLPPSPTNTSSIASDVGGAGQSSAEQRSKTINIPRRTDGKPRGQGWYGSWKGKAAPVTQVHNESVGSKSPSDDTMAGLQRDGSSAPRENTSSPHKYMNAGTQRLTKGVPLRSLTSSTNVSFAAGTSTHSLVNTNDPLSKPEEPFKDIDPPLPPDPATEVVQSEASSVKTAVAPQVSSAGWFTGWWSRPDGFTEKAPTSKDEAPVVEQAVATPLPASEVSLVSETDTPTAAAATADRKNVDGKVDVNQESSKSWFSRWTTTQNSKVLDISTNEGTETPKAPLQDDSRPSTATDITKDDSVTNGKALPSQNATKKSVNDINARKATGWIFWAKDNPESPDAMEDADDAVSKQVGELAVANSPSETRPEAAQFNSSKEQDGDPKVISEQNSVPEEPQSHKQPPKSKSKSQKGKRSGNLEKKPSPSTDAKSSLLKISSHKQDILLPRFATTYSMVQKPSLLQNLRQYFLGGPQEHPHLQLIEHPRRIKNALAIGIHGFFPNALYQKLLGAPTGTSIKFSNMAAAAIKSWTEARGYDCKIEKASLEGEGLIADRVEMLWKLLLNWIEHIRSADFILFACHSQGVPVTVQLVDRLLKFGCVSSAKIGICAMAGVNLGPFAEYRTQLFGRSALELFDFSNPASKVSTAYRTALTEVLKHNVKIVFTGSLDDQLVSLESSTFSNISHPCIYRAAFIDGRFFTSDFITELVGFALKLRNLGLSDHGLIRELSPALAGSLYSGEGHSRLYDSPDVYNLAVSHALETTSPPDNTLVVVTNYEGPPGKDSNPYFLPWAMRGILEEEKVRKELSEELSDLLGLFEQWKPTTKQLKDIRYKLEALKSKL